MIKHKIYRLVAFLLVFPYYMLLGQSAYADAEFSIYDSTDVYVSKCKWAIDKREEYPDESYAMMKESHAYFLRNNDTAHIVSCLLSMSDYTTMKKEYALSFQYLWEALYLGNKMDDPQSISVANRRLARLYATYNMPEISMNHLKNALLAAKKLNKDEINIVQLNVSYLNIASKKRQLQQYSEALTYLDSCVVNDDVLDQTPWYYVSYHLEVARVYMNIGDFQKADYNIKLAESVALKTNNSSQVNIKRVRAELLMMQRDYDKVIVTLKEALRIVNANKHVEITSADLYKKLGSLYFDKGRYFAAYNALNSFVLISDSVQAAQVKNNSEIFKINDSYQLALQDKEATIERQVEIIEDKQKMQNRLSIIIGLLLLLITTLGMVWRMRIRLYKTLEEKEKTALRARLDEEQREKKMNLKNQELTSFALQLVDKETSVKELLEKIKELSPIEYKKINSKYQLSEKGTWEEFNLRFTEVNKGFYERLTARFPNLSRTEQKHCALIKLNFSTKEMAQILNVEGHTINMSRSRIRKKMGLDRAENLSNFIGTI